MNQCYLLPGFMVNQRLLVDPPLFPNIFGVTPKIFGQMKIVRGQTFLVQKLLVSKDLWFQSQIIMVPQRFLVDTTKNLQTGQSKDFQRFCIKCLNQQCNYHLQTEILGDIMLDTINLGTKNLGSSISSAILSGMF